MEFQRSCKVINTEKLAKGSLPIIIIFFDDFLLQGGFWIIYNDNKLIADFRLNYFQWKFHYNMYVLSTTKVKKEEKANKGKDEIKSST